MYNKLPLSRSRTRTVQSITRNLILCLVLMRIFHSSTALFTMQIILFSITPHIIKLSKGFIMLLFNFDFYCVI